jgi:hypothetical protein
MPCTVQLVTDATARTGMSPTLRFERGGVERSQSREIGTRGANVQCGAIGNGVALGVAGPEIRRCDALEPLREAARGPWHHIGQ